MSKNIILIITAIISFICVDYLYRLILSLFFDITTSWVLYIFGLLIIVVPVCLLICKFVSNKVKD